jgi:hypothetical protein
MGLSEVHITVRPLLKSRHCDLHGYYIVPSWNQNYCQHVSCFRIEWPCNPSIPEALSSMNHPCLVACYPQYKQLLHSTLWDQALIIRSNPATQDLSCGSTASQVNGKMMTWLVREPQLPDLRWGSPLPSRELVPWQNQLTEHPRAKLIWCLASQGNSTG